MIHRILVWLGFLREKRVANASGGREAGDSHEREAESRRIWQLDALRGVAMVLMAIFHSLVDIRDFFGFADIRYFEPPFMYIGSSSAVLFMIVSGACCRLSKNNILRGAKLLLIAMFVTLATYIFIPQLYIRFGILHFLGSAMIITGLLTIVPISKNVRRIVTWALALFVLILGQYVKNVKTELPYLFPLGIVTDDFHTYDFYPLLPWLGVFLAGYSLGEIVLNNRAKLASFRVGKLTGALTDLGGYSLLFYILHQPALLAVFWIFDRLFSIVFHV